MYTPVWSLYNLAVRHIQDTCSCSSESRWITLIKTYHVGIYSSDPSDILPAPGKEDVVHLNVSSPPPSSFSGEFVPLFGTWTRSDSAQHHAFVGPVSYRDFSLQSMSKLLT